MKQIILLAYLLLSLQLAYSQQWNIISQNSQNSSNFTPEKVWMSPSGNRMIINVYTQNDILFLGQQQNLLDNTTVLYLEGDTLFNTSQTFRFDQSQLISSFQQEWNFISDSSLFVQTILDSGDVIYNYSASKKIEIIRTIIDLKSKLCGNVLISENSLSNLFTKNNIYSNQLFFKDTVFASKAISLMNAPVVGALLEYTSALEPHDVHQMTFFKPDSTVAGSMRAFSQDGKYRMLEGGTSTNGGRIFDVNIDDAKCLVVTDTSGNKEKVFTASKNATFPYMNYDGNNLYFRCSSSGPTFIQNTQAPPFSFGKIDSGGILEWAHAVPPNASIVQDSAFRTYVFGYLRNGYAYFGDTINDLNLYMAVIDSNGSILHFETDSNWFWPNSYFYKLMYSSKTGVNLFMSHVEPLQLGNLKVPNDSGNQNMFLARFTYLVPEDSSSTDISEIKYAFDIKLFPNPAAESINIKSSEEFTQLRLMNVNGQVLKSLEEIKEKEHQLDLSQLSPGSYFIQLHTKYGIRSKRFVKE